MEERDILIVTDSIGLDQQREQTLLGALLSAEALPPKLQLLGLFLELFVEGGAQGPPLDHSFPGFVLCVILTHSSSSNNLCLSP